MSVFDRLPLLPTTVVGSYPVPEWMERLKTDYYRGRISRTQLQSVHDMAIKAALKDQELAGIDIVSDGEMRRDNDIDYFLARIPGIVIAQTSKDFYFDYYDTAVRQPLPLPTGTELSWLAEDFAFTAAHTCAPIKFSFTGPYSLARRIRDGTYTDKRELVLALAHRLNDAAHALAARGVELLQIDEPFLAGYPRDVEIAIEAVNVVTRDVDISWALHVCYGNRYARPLWEGHYDFLFPADDRRLLWHDARGSAGRRRRRFHDAPTPCTASAGSAGARGIRTALDRPRIRGGRGDRPTFWRQCGHGRRRHRGPSRAHRSGFCFRRQRNWGPTQFDQCRAPPATPGRCRNDRDHHYVGQDHHVVTGRSAWRPRVRHPDRRV